LILMEHKNFLSPALQMIKDRPLSGLSHPMIDTDLINKDKLDLKTPEQKSQMM
jgi:hypothetical protein